MYDDVPWSPNVSSQQKSLCNPFCRNLCYQSLFCETRTWVNRPLRLRIGSTLLICTFVLGSHSAIYFNLRMIFFKAFLFCFFQVSSNGEANGLCIGEYLGLAPLLHSKKKRQTWECLSIQPLNILPFFLW